MKALGEAAIDLAWLPPCTGPLTALSRPQPALVWHDVRHDPGSVLLLARSVFASEASPLAGLRDPTLLFSLQHFLSVSRAPFLDWRRPGLDRILTVAIQQARLAAALAAKVGACDVERAWTGGLSAPLGWFAVAAVDADNVPDYLAEHDSQTHEAQAAGVSWQIQRWGLDATAIARRLARAWGLPSWLVPLVGHLGLHVSIASRLGADPVLFQVVQLAVTWQACHGRGLGLPVGAAVDELLTNLGLSPAAVEALAEQCLHEPISLPSSDASLSPTVLSDLLRLAHEERRRVESMERLQHDLDQLQQALEHQCCEERDRLETKKLSALAELAAGAGHEINNPLAVISGQAQYLLKQIELAEELLVEDPSPTLYLDELKGKLTKSLTTIVGQAQRIHHVLTDLMQFAKPAPARQQAVRAAKLIDEVAAALGPFAGERGVRLEVPATCDEEVIGDPAQMRTALANLVRNAVEAAGSDGWARIRLEIRAEDVLFVVEDSGPGPAPQVREHLFDPFFSGRAAGRGRGLGLPTAWRLARHNGGDVIFDSAHPNGTCFVLSLPRPHSVLPSQDGRQLRPAASGAA